MAQRKFDDTIINVEFEEVKNRQQIESGDEIKTLFGKIRKFLSDLKAIAFSGKASDLDNDMGFQAINGLAEGTSLLLNNAVDANLYSISVYGNSTDGTPTPDAPIEINNVGDSGNLNITACGKSLLDNRLLVKKKDDGRYTEMAADGRIHFVNSTGGFFRVDVPIELPQGDYIFIKNNFELVVGTSAYIGFNINNGSGHYNASEFTLTEKSTVTITLTTSNQTTVGEYYCNILIAKKGNTTDYEVYKGNTATITTALPLCSVGDVKDELIFNADGTAKIIKRAYLADNLTLGSALENCNVYSATSPYELINSGKCTHSNICIYSGEDKEHFFTYSTAIRVYLPKEYNITASDIKVLAVLQNPIEINLTADETAALSSLETFEGLTNVFNTDNASMKVTYWTNEAVGHSISDIREDLRNLNLSGGTTLESLGVTATANELNYMDGVTSNVQTQLDSKAPSSHNHTAEDVGLGNVDNTADADKNVKYATSAGSAMKLQTYKKDSTTETYGEEYPLRAQWIDGTTLKLKVDGGYTVKVDNVTGTVAIANGGTGATTAKAAQYNILTDIPVGASGIDDATQFAFKYATPDSSKGTLYYRVATTIWDYIKSKISSVLGLTATQYDGNSKTSTTATKISLSSDLSGEAEVDAFYNGYYLNLAKARNYTNCGFAGGDGMILNIPWSTAYGAQIGIDDSNNKMSLRTLNNGTWNEWTDITTTHGLLNTNLFEAMANTSEDSGWSMICPEYTSQGAILKTFRTQANAPSWTLGDYAAGIIFGGADTKGVITQSYASPRIKFAGGNGVNTTSPKWWMQVTGTSEVSYPLNTMLSVGNEIFTNNTDHSYQTSSLLAEAGSIKKLDLIHNQSAGSTTKPVYMAGGVAKPCTYTLGKSVPSDAKFTDTTYSAATTSADGLMTAAMVTKLNGIATGANAYSLPTASSSTLGGVKTTSTVTSTSGLTACPIISGVPYYKDTNTTYSLSSFGVTATAAELNILDGVTATATELNYCDGVTSNIQTQLNGKAASSHGTHVTFTTTTPKAAGTAAVGSATTVSRSDHVHPAQTTVSGNAGSATKLATARNITIGNATKSFDGSAAISFSLSEIGVSSGSNATSIAGYPVYIDGTTTLSDFEDRGLAVSGLPASNSLIFTGDKIVASQPESLFTKGVTSTWTKVSGGGSVSTNSTLKTLVIKHSTTTTDTIARSNAITFGNYSDTFGVFLFIFTGSGNTMTNQGTTFAPTKAYVEIGTTATAGTVASFTIQGANVGQWGTYGYKTKDEATMGDSVIFATKMIQLSEYTGTYYIRVKLSSSSSAELNVAVLAV